MGKVIGVGLACLMLAGCSATEAAPETFSKTSAVVEASIAPSKPPFEAAPDAQEPSTHTLTTSSSSDFPCNDSVAVSLIGAWDDPAEDENRIADSSVGEFDAYCRPQTHYIDHDPPVAWDVRSVVDVYYDFNGTCDGATDVVISGNDGVLCDYPFSNRRYVYGFVIVGDAWYALGGQVFDPNDEGDARAMIEMILSAQITRA